MIDNVRPKVLLMSNVLCDKIEAHKMGLAHYAFSIIVSNSHNKILLQQRALSKYHSGSLWTNACCGHPTSIDGIIDIQHQAICRLYEEMGINIGKLEYLFNFSYRGKCDCLIENEQDYVFFCKYDSEIRPNPDEVNDYKWMDLEDLDKDMKDHPNNYTLWFKEIWWNNKSQLQTVIFR